MTRREVFGALGLAVGAAMLPKLVKAEPTGQAIVDKNNILFSKVKLTDKWKHTIPLAFEWNMDTETAGLYVSVSGKNRVGNNTVAVMVKDKKGQIAKAYAHLPGCKLRWRDTGKLVTREEILKGVIA